MFGELFQELARGFVPGFCRAIKDLQTAVAVLRQAQLTIDIRNAERLGGRTVTSVQRPLDRFAEQIRIGHRQRDSIWLRRYRLIDTIIPLGLDNPRITYLRDITRLGLPFPLSSEEEEYSN